MPCDLHNTLSIFQKLTFVCFVLYECVCFVIVYVYVYMGHSLYGKQEDSILYLQAHQGLSYI